MIAITNINKFINGVRRITNEDVSDVTQTSGILLYSLLRKFQEQVEWCPDGMDLPEWKEKIGIMADSFEYAARRGLWSVDSQEEFEVVQEGFELFGKYFVYLWL